MAQQEVGLQPDAGVQAFVPCALEQGTTVEEPHVSQSK